MNLSNIIPASERRIHGAGPSSKNSINTTNVYVCIYLISHCLVKERKYCSYSWRPLHIPFPNSIPFSFSPDQRKHSQGMWCVTFPAICVFIFYLLMDVFTLLVSSLNIYTAIKSYIAFCNFPPILPPSPLTNIVLRSSHATTCGWSSSLVTRIVNLLICHTLVIFL